MRIMVFYFFLRYGGIEKNFMHLANFLIDKEEIKHLDFVMMSAEGPFLNGLSKKINTIDLKLIPFRILDHIKCIFKLSYIIRKNRPNFILTGMPAGNITVIISWLLSFSYKTKIIISEHGPTLLWLKNRKNNSFVKLFLRTAIPILYKIPIKIIVVSKFLINDLARIALVNKKRMVCIYNPVIPSDIKEKMGEQVDHRWLSNIDFITILAASRLAKEKNYPLLLKAFAEVSRQRENCRLIILGDGPERANLENLVKELGLSSKVDMPGFAANPLPYMKQANIFVLSSSYEGLPTALIEALAAGCPVIATDCPGGVREILEDGKYGILVPVNDVGGLKEAIIKTLDGEEGARGKSLDFQEHKMGEFTLSYAAGRYRELLSSLNKS